MVAVGDRVTCTGYDSVGTVRFIGETHAKKDKVFYGVELDNAVGKNNGSIQNIKYFGPCQDKHGVFVTGSKVTPVPEKAQKPDAEEDTEPTPAPKPATPPPSPKKMASKKKSKGSTKVAPTEMVAESPLDEDNQAEERAEAKRQELEAATAKRMADAETARLEKERKSKEQEEALRLEGMSDWIEAFKLFDTDSSGEITQQELGTVLRTLGGHTTNQQAADMIAEYDQDHSGTISLDEFVLMMKANPLKMDVGNQDLNAEGFPDAKGAQSEWIKICNAANDPGDTSNHMTALIAANKKATEARKQKIQDDAKEIEAEIRRVEMEKHEVEARKQRQEAEITALAQLRQEEEEQRIEQTQQRSAGAAEERATQQAEQDKFVRAKEGYEVEDRVDVSFLGAGTVMYVGIHKSDRKFKNKLYGVDLDEAPSEADLEDADCVGLLTHQGKFDRAYYFRCNQDRGILVLQSQMSLKTSVQQKVDSVVGKSKPTQVVEPTPDAKLPPHIKSIPRDEATALLRLRPPMTLIVYNMAAATSGMALLFVGRNGTEESRKINNVSGSLSIGQSTETFDTIEELSSEAARRKVQGLPDKMALYDPNNYDNPADDDYGFDIDDFDDTTELDEKKTKAAALAFEKKGNFLAVDSTVAGTDGKPRQVWPPTCGDTVLVTGVGRGQVKYSGPLVGFSAFGDLFAGVELEQSVGKMDGTYMGTSYFRCKDKRGLMVPIVESKIKIISKGDESLQDDQPEPEPARFDVSEREDREKEERKAHELAAKREAVAENNEFMSSFESFQDIERARIAAEEEVKAANQRKLDEAAEKAKALAAKALEMEKKEAARKEREAKAAAEQEAAEAQLAEQRAVVEKEAKEKAKAEKEAKTAKRKKADAAKAAADTEAAAAEKKPERKKSTKPKPTQAKPSETPAAAKTQTFPGTENMKIGQRCNPSGKSSTGGAYGPGTIKFIGEHFKKPGEALIGVQLDEANGKNSGSLPTGAGWKGCPDQHGIFVGPLKVNPV